MMNEYEELIKNIPPLKLAKVAGVARDMAQKYKSGYSLPTLKKAILIEDTFGIPARAWVDIKNQKDSAI